MFETAITFAENNPSIAAIILGSALVITWWLGAAIPYVPQERRHRLAILGFLFLVAGAAWQIITILGLVWEPIKSRNAFMNHFQNVILEDRSRSQSFAWRSDGTLEGFINQAKTTGTWTFDSKGYCRKMVKEATDLSRSRVYPERCFSLHTNGKSLRFISVGVTRQILTRVDR